MTRVVQVGTTSSAASGGGGGGGSGPRRFRESRYVQAWQVTPASGTDVAEWCGGVWNPEPAPGHVTLPAAGMTRGRVADVGDWVVRHDPDLSDLGNPGDPDEATLRPLFHVVSSQGFRRGYERATPPVSQEPEGRG